LRNPRRPAGALGRGTRALGGEASPVSWEVTIQATVGDFALDVSLASEANHTVIMGPNGSGKTTLLRMIAGAYTPAKGRITIGGRTVFDSAERIALPPEERRIGYVPQGFGLFPHLSVVDNVAFGLGHGSPRASSDTRREKALGLLAELGCEALAERFPARLSGGEQQRVALARALVVEPALLLLDEPLSTLDPTRRRRLREFLAHRLSSGEQPAITVTHDVSDVEALGASLVVLEAGRIVQRGTVAELRAEPATDFVAAFFDR
ncbi:MAG: ABC transporter ATP-binding protein, partial [Myxococcota bacterium]